MGDLGCALAQFVVITHRDTSPLGFPDGYVAFPSFSSLDELVGHVFRLGFLGFPVLPLWVGTGPLRLLPTPRTRFKL
jgi:hypothetical protein